MLHNFYHGYKFVTTSLLPSKAGNTNLHLKRIFGCVKVYDGSFFPSTVSMWNKLPPHINTVSVELFSDHLCDLDLHYSYIFAYIQMCHQIVHTGDLVNLSTI